MAQPPAHVVSIVLDRHISSARLCATTGQCLCIWCIDSETIDRRELLRVCNKLVSIVLSYAPRSRWLLQSSVSQSLIVITGLPIVAGLQWSRSILATPDCKEKKQKAEPSIQAANIVHELTRHGKVKVAVMRVACCESLS